MELMGIRLVPLGLWISASAGLWISLFNRYLLRLVDGPAKLSATAGSLVAMGAGAIWAAATPWITAHWLPAAAIGLLALGEVRRAILRRAYEITPTKRGSEPRWPRTTTTAFEVQHYAVGPPLTGPQSGLRILLLTDFHLTSRLPFEYYERVLAEAGEYQPDVVVLTGDYVTRKASIALLPRLLRSVPASKFGTFAILGNHDHWAEPEQISSMLQSAGITLLGGRCCELTMSDERRIRICGTEKPWGPAFRCPNADAGVTTFVLSHTPDNIYELARAGVDAVFAGHTHAGQWRLPWLGAIVVPSRYGRRFDHGHFKIDKTHLFVSAGVGSDRPALRIACPPEIVIVDWNFS